MVLDISEHQANVNYSKLKADIMEVQKCQQQRRRQLKSWTAGLG